MNDDIIIGLDFLEAHHGILDLNNNGYFIHTELNQDKDSQANQIYMVILPSSQVIPPNTITNIPITLEESLLDDYIVQPMKDSKGLLGSNILGRGKQTYMQFINDSNKCIKLPRGKCVGFAQTIGKEYLIDPMLDSEE